MSDGVSAPARPRSTSVVESYLRTSAVINGHAARVATWQVKKRDGRLVAFDVDRCYNAILNCFHSLPQPPAQPERLAARVAKAVINVLVGRGKDLFEVEEIQRVVIAQLWAADLAAAAEHYTIYREERRRIRAESFVPDPELVARIAQDAAHFPSPLQYAQFIGKFSRWREADKRRETWAECNGRVFDWFGTIPQFHLLRADEVAEMRKTMYDLQASPAMRVVQMAGPALERCHIGVYNCLSGDTRFISDRGVRALEDFEDGDEVTVLTHTGRWQPATVRRYGQGLVRTISFSRGSGTQTVRATADHRWILADGTVTTQLKVGDRIAPPPCTFTGWSYDDSANNATFRVSAISDEQELVDLWCLEVQDDQSFVLPGGIVTGNCAATPIQDLRCFAELLYILMQGSGCGFSVEGDLIGELPLIKKQRTPAVLQQYTVGDSTEEWCDGLLFGLQRWFDGEDVEFDLSPIRKAGSPLKTKGGRSSGPEPLRRLLDFTRKIVLGAQGRRLTDLEVHDICCMIGKIVQVGGVRRASMISLSDLNSGLMRQAKHGNWYEHSGQRAMANNSAVFEFDDKPPIEVFMEEWLALVRSRSGERGIFNRTAACRTSPERRKKTRYICNPCGEIRLRFFGLCNLSIAILRGDESVEEIKRRVKIATYFGVLQSCCTKFQYVRDEWRQNAEEERLLGVDIMGHLDHPLLCPGAPGRAQLVTELKELVAQTAQELSERFGIPYSAANTCLKPGGDSSVFFGTTSLMPYFSQYQIRRTRESVTVPMCQFLKDQGVPWEPAAEDEQGLVAFAWPKKNRDGCITRDHMTAIDQLENWLFWQRTWAEHSCSATIQVKDDEWLAVGAWVYEHFNEVTGLAFLPYDSGTYRTVPNEALTEEQYNEMMARFPTIDWAQLQRYEREDFTEASQSYACTAQGCSI